MKLNKAGKELYDIWEEKFYKENDRLGGNSSEGKFVAGWGIIDTPDFIKSITDDCGVLIFGYDDMAISYIESCIDDFGGDFPCNDIGYTFADLRDELLKYFVDE